MALKRRKGFTLTEVIIVMMIIILVMGMIFFIITFIFKTMYRINFNIETISVFETVQSRLDGVFSMWYLDYDKTNGGLIFDDKNKTVNFPTFKIADDIGTLKLVQSNAKVFYQGNNHAIKLKISGESEKVIYKDAYISNIIFGTSTTDERTISATITFTSSNGKFSEEKFTKFRTVN